MLIKLAVLAVFYFVVLPYIVHLIYKYIFKGKNELEKVLLQVLASMILFIAASFSFYGYGDYELYDTRELVALQDSETLVVSRYSADSKIYYYYMHKVGDSYYPKQASQSLSMIRYTEGYPVVKVFRQEAPNKVIAFLSYSSGMVGEYKYEFYLPNGTIKEEFNIDLN